MSEPSNVVSSSGSRPALDAQDVKRLMLQPRPGKRPRVEIHVADQTKARIDAALTFYSGLTSAPVSPTVLFCRALSALENELTAAADGLSREEFAAREIAALNHASTRKRFHRRLPKARAAS